MTHAIGAPPAGQTIADVTSEAGAVALAGARLLTQSKFTAAAVILSQTPAEAQAFHDLLCCFFEIFEARTTYLLAEVDGVTKPAASLKAKEAPAGRLEKTRAEESSVFLVGDLVPPPLRVAG